MVSLLVVSPVQSSERLNGTTEIAAKRPIKYVVASSELATETQLFRQGYLRKKDMPPPSL